MLHTGAKAAFLPKELISGDTSLCSGNLYSSETKPYVEVTCHLSINTQQTQNYLEKKVNYFYVSNN